MEGGRKEKKEIPHAMTSDEKSKSFAGVDADRNEKKKKNIGRSRKKWR